MDEKFFQRIALHFKKLIHKTIKFRTSNNLNSIIRFDFHKYAHLRKSEVNELKRAFYKKEMNDKKKLEDQFAQDIRNDENAIVLKTMIEGICIEYGSNQTMRKFFVNAMIELLGSKFSPDLGEYNRQQEIIFLSETVTEQTKTSFLLEKRQKSSRILIESTFDIDHLISCFQNIAVPHKSNISKELNLNYILIINRPRKGVVLRNQKHPYILIKPIRLEFFGPKFQSNSSLQKTFEV